MRRFLLMLAGFVLALPAWSQIYYSASQTTTLSAAAEIVTIQAPATQAAMTKLIQMKGVAVVCSVACTVSLERDGTAATSTSLTTNPILNGEPASTATAWHSSNVGTGTVLSQYQIAAGGTLNLDLTNKWMGTPGQNVTIRTSSITGTVNINFMWIEWSPTFSPDSQH